MLRSRVVARTTTYPPPRLLKHPTSTMAFISSPLHIAGLLSALDVRQLAHSFTGALMQQSTFRNVDYDVHPTTGFFPSQPLQKLPSPFSLWEAALEGAQGAVSLGDDESDEALEKRQSGETFPDIVACARHIFHAGGPQDTAKTALRSGSPARFLSRSLPSRRHWAPPPS